MFISTKNQSSLRKIEKPAAALIKAKICPFSTTFLKSISQDSPFKVFLQLDKNMLFYIINCWQSKQIFHLQALLYILFQEGQRKLCSTKTFSWLKE
jgi:hypothetical protein